MRHRPQACRHRRLRRVETSIEIVASGRGKIRQKLVERESIPGTPIHFGKLNETVNLRENFAACRDDHRVEVRDVFVVLHRVGQRSSWIPAVEKCDGLSIGGSIRDIRTTKQGYDLFGGS